jgi:hypothetical protein
MTMQHRFVVLCVILAAGAAGAAVAAAGEPAAPVTADSVASNDDCCFANPRYTGVCRVTPGADETCADILAYLNNQSSVGKTYCGNTKVRGGWAQVDCDNTEQRCAGTSASEPIHEPM